MEENLTPFEKKELSQNVEKIVEENFSLEEESTNFYKNLEIKWETLEELRSELAQEFVKFTADILKIVLNKEIHLYLEDDKDAYNTSANILLRDIHNFTIDMKQLYESHKDKTGLILTDEDYSLYTRLSNIYQEKYNNIITILAPVLTDIAVIYQNVQYRMMRKKEEEKTMGQETEQKPLNKEIGQEGV